MAKEPGRVTVESAPFLAFMPRAVQMYMEATFKAAERLLDGLSESTAKSGPLRDLRVLADYYEHLQSMGGDLQKHTERAAFLHELGEFIGSRAVEGKGPLPVMDMTPVLSLSPQSRQSSRDLTEIQDATAIYVSRFFGSLSTSCYTKAPLCIDPLAHNSFYYWEWKNRTRGDAEKALPHILHRALQGVLSVNSMSGSKSGKEGTSVVRSDWGVLFSVMSKSLSDRERLRLSARIDSTKAAVASTVQVEAEGTPSSDLAPVSVSRQEKRGIPSAMIERQYAFPLYEKVASLLASREASAGIDLGMTDPDIYFHGKGWRAGATVYWNAHFLAWLGGLEEVFGAAVPSPDEPKASKMRSKDGTQVEGIDGWSYGSDPARLSLDGFNKGMIRDIAQKLAMKSLETSKAPRKEGADTSDRFKLPVLLARRDPYVQESDMPRLMQQFLNGLRRRIPCAPTQRDSNDSDKSDDEAATPRSRDRSRGDSPKTVDPTDPRASRRVDSEETESMILEYLSRSPIIELDASDLASNCGALDYERQQSRVQMSIAECQSSACCHRHDTEVRTAAKEATLNKTLGIHVPERCHSYREIADAYRTCSEISKALGPLLEYRVRSGKSAKLEGRVFAPWFEMGSRHDSHSSKYEMFEARDTANVPVSILSEWKQTAEYLETYFETLKNQALACNPVSYSSVEKTEPEAALFLAMHPARSKSVVPLDSTARVFTSHVRPFVLGSRRHAHDVDKAATRSVFSFYLCMYTNEVLGSLKDEHVTQDLQGCSDELAAKLMSTRFPQLHCMRSPWFGKHVKAEATATPVPQPALDIYRAMSPMVALEHTRASLNSSVLLLAAIHKFYLYTFTLLHKELACRRSPRNLLGALAVTIGSAKARLDEVTTDVVSKGKYVKSDKALYGCGNSGRLVMDPLHLVKRFRVWDGRVSEDFSLAMPAQIALHATSTVGLALHSTSSLRGNSGSSYRLNVLRDGFASLVTQLIQDIAMASGDVVIQDWARMYQRDAKKSAAPAEITAKRRREHTPLSMATTISDVLFRTERQVRGIMNGYAHEKERFLKSEIQRKLVKDSVSYTSEAYKKDILNESTKRALNSAAPAFGGFGNIPHHLRSCIYASTKCWWAQDVVMCMDANTVTMRWSRDASRVMEGCLAGFFE